MPRNSPSDYRIRTHRTGAHTHTSHMYMSVSTIGGAVARPDALAPKSCDRLGDVDFCASCAPISATERAGASVHTDLALVLFPVYAISLLVLIRNSVT